MPLVFDLEAARNLGVAVVAGLAVGVEREWSGHAAGPSARFAGARTFLLLGLVGGIAGWLVAGGEDALGVLTLGAGLALTVSAYVMAARRGPADVEGTTEVAAVAVLTLGAASGLGFPLLTSGATSVVVLALAEKTRIHQWARSIGERELGAALQFAVLALVILPLLPPGPYGPMDTIRPRALWTLVLLLSGLNFAGYVARRAVGPTAGYGLTGLLGGVVSSTAVTLAFATQSRRQTSLSAALAGGVVASGSVMTPRVLLVTAALRPDLAAAALPYCIPVLLLSVAIVGWTVWRQTRQARQEGETPDPGSPLGLKAAIRMALLFQVVLTAVPLVQQMWGSGGVMLTAVLLGVADIDALTVSMAALAASATMVPLAARAIVAGIAAATVLKLILALALGSNPFRRRSTPGLAALAATACLGLWLALR